MAELVFVLYISTMLCTFLRLYKTLGTRRSILLSAADMAKASHVLKGHHHVNIVYIY